MNYSLFEDKNETPFLTLQQQQLQPKFSITCIFCASPNSQALNKEQTFRKCLNCNKHFQCTALPANNIQSFPSYTNIKPPSTFQTFQRPLFIEPKKEPLYNQQEKTVRQQLDIQQQCNQDHYFLSRCNLYR